MTLWTGALGTWGLRQKPGDQWDRPDSPFSSYLRTQGFEQVGGHERLFRGWSTDVDGPPVFGDNDWESGSDAWIDYLQARRLVGPDLKALVYFVAILHSHAGNLGLIAAAKGLQLPAAVLVSTPIVKHTEAEVVPKAMPNIGVCLHLSDAGIDWTALAGQLFDRRVSFRRTYKPETGIICRQSKSVGHSGLLAKPDAFHKWADEGFLDIVREQLGWRERLFAKATAGV